MNVSEFIKELGARSSLLWGVAVGSSAVTVLDRWGGILGLPSEYRWAPPTLAVVSWCVIATGLVALAGPPFSNWLKRNADDKKSSAYAIKNLQVAGNFERQILMHFKSQNRKRFRAPRDRAAFAEMVRHGLLKRDSLDSRAYMQHFVIRDEVWDYLDNPPPDWKKLGKVHLDWET